MENSFTIGIIGGAGKMGQFFKNFFEKKGYPVLISDKNYGLSYEELLSQSKVILLSLPMEVFEEVVKKIAPFIEERHWILDICSLKLKPAQIMKKYLKKGELLATHPLFGPYEKDLQGKIIAFYPLRGKNLYQWFVSLIKEEGLKPVKIVPRQHDKVMALVQVVNHFWLILLGKLLLDLKIKEEELINLSTPSFLAQLHILKRLSKQEADLYARIQLDNPFGKKFRKILCQNCQELTKIFNSQDERANQTFKKIFEKVKNLAKNLETLLLS